MNFASFIPQVFYDFIARLTSGFTILFTVSMIWWHELALLRTIFKNCIKESSLLTGVAIIIVAYVVALVLEGLRHIEIISFLKFKENLKNSENEKALDKTKTISNDKLLRMRIWHNCLKQYKKSFEISLNYKIPRVSDALEIDWIRMKKPEAGSRIVKLRAELALFKTLSHGWLFVMVMYNIFMFFTCFLLTTECHSVMRSIITVLALVIGITCIEHRRKALEESHLCALYNHWLIIINSKNES